MEQRTDTGRVERELEAMRQVVQVLSGLPDENARARVLRWAAEHLTVAQASAHAPIQGMARAELAATSQPKPTDIDSSGLTFDDLESLFEADASAPGTSGEEPVAAEAGASQSRGIVKDFQRNASGRQSA